MDGNNLYDTDILLWSEHQAALLRALAARRDLPNALDLENVAEEIEAVGRSELNAAESNLLQLLVHILKAAADPESPAWGHWKSETLGYHRKLRRHLTPSMRRRIDVDDTWRDALRIADSRLEEHHRDAARVRLKLCVRGTSCPFALDAIVDECFDFAATAGALIPIQPPAGSPASETSPIAS